jgi:hypothetical protein
VHKGRENAVKIHRRYNVGSEETIGDIVKRLIANGKKFKINEVRSEFRKRRPHVEFSDYKMREIIKEFVDEGSLELVKNHYYPKK